MNRIKKINKDLLKIHNALSGKKDKIENIFDDANLIRLIIELDAIKYLFDIDKKYALNVLKLFLTINHWFLMPDKLYVEIYLANHKTKKSKLIQMATKCIDYLKKALNS